MRIIILMFLLVISFTISAKTYYVAPTGGSDSNPGTISQPWATWQKAFDMAEPGDTVYFRGGVYYSSGQDVYPRIDPYGYFPHGHTGTVDNPICYFAYPDDWADGNYPILDCSGHTSAGSLTHGIVINRVQYIKFRGLTIRNLYQRGTIHLPCAITIDWCANLTFENMIIHDISGRGVWWSEIVGYYDETITPEIIYSDTTKWINCDFYNLCDSTSANPGNAADGIKGTLNGRTSADYPLASIYLNGCRFWNYSDDGTDIGGAGIVIHENCWASSTNKYASLGIEGNGFKSGGGSFDLLPADSLLLVNWRKFSNCIAANCEGEGFYDLDYWPYLRNRSLFYNNTSYNNLVGYTAKNNVSYRPRNSTYKNNIVYSSNKFENGIYVEVEIGSNSAATYPESHNTWDAYDPSPGSWPFFKTADTTVVSGVIHPIKVTDDDFVSHDANELFLFRKNDGSLPDINFLKLASTSDLIDAGIDVGLPYSGSAPDLGYSEHQLGPITITNPIYLSSVIETSTPTKLEMTYNQTLANIVPSASAFIVKVNSDSRNVTFVSVSGTKVTLTIASPVINGDLVTVSYTKPLSNPLQSASGGQANSISDQTVKNNVVAINQSPLVNISSPTKSTSFIAPATITIDASASDPDGNISKVEFYQGTVKLGERTAVPYSFTWKDVSEGTYSITAIATDDKNTRTTSAPVSIVVEKSAPSVNQAPEVSIIIPSKKKYKKHDNIVITVEASDPDGIINRVELKNGNASIAEMTTAPYVYTLEDVDTSTYLFTAIATDNLGAKSVSTTIELRVENYDVNSELINLYPNPNNGRFSIDMYSSSLQEGKISLSIISLTGKTIFEDIITDQENFRVFDLTEAPAGTYVLMVYSGNTIISTKKFIKE